MHERLVILVTYGQNTLFGLLTSVVVNGKLSTTIKYFDFMLCYTLM